MDKNKLTDKQRRFVIAYATDGQNGTKAAREAGYGGNESALAAAASRMLRLPKIKAAIAQLTRDALAKLQKQRRDAVADLAECLEFNTTVMRTRLGDFVDDHGGVSIEKLRAAPAGVVKRLKVRNTAKVTSKEFELESAGSASERLIRHYDGLDSDGRAEGLLARVLLEQLAPAAVAAIAKAMLSGNGPGRRTIDVKGKVIE